MLSLSLPLLFTVSERKFSRPSCTGETKDSSTSPHPTKFRWILRQHASQRWRRQNKCGMIDPQLLLSRSTMIMTAHAHGKAEVIRKSHHRDNRRRRDAANGNKLDVTLSYRRTRSYEESRRSRNGQPFTNEPPSNPIPPFNMVERDVVCRKRPEFPPNKCLKRKIRYCIL